MSDTQTTERKIRTITLTGRPPVRIVEDDWPVMADGEVDDHDGGQVRYQADRSTTATIRVRQHRTDGRTIVYGVWEYDTRWQGEQGRTERAGVLIPCPEGTVISDTEYAVWDGIIAAIGEVAASLAEMSGDTERTSRAARLCIADLPAIDL